jgi:hypothetical protein
MTLLTELTVAPFRMRVPAFDPVELPMTVLVVRVERASIAPTG